MASTSSTSPPSPEVMGETQTASEREITIACSCLVAITFILRGIGRYALMRRVGVNKLKFLGMDDAFNVLALVAFTGLVISVFNAIHRGMGTHLEVIMYYKGQEGVDQYNLSIYLCAFFYNTVLGMIKLSVLSLYRRILRGIQSRMLPKLNWIVFVIVCMSTGSNMLVVLFQCRPVEAAFRASVKGECVNAPAFYLGNAITGIITDSMVYLLAVPIVKPLQMELKRKIVTLMTLLVGAFAVITSCVRLGFLPALLINPDISWAMGVPMDWSVVEPTVGFIVSSIPAITSIRYLFRPDGVNSSTERSHKSNGHIKLQDFREQNGHNQTSVTSTGRPWRHHNAEAVTNDSGSEDRLVYGGKGNGISQTTEFQVTYASKDDV